ncbi:MAG: fumarylacetoacetate hydrolase family protein [Anaerolineales bacterium]|nr:fumarylacetoacetate hydrolase family protein [Anaerolineales bacterium]
MKLISFAINGEDRIGAVIDDIIVDLQPALQEYQKHANLPDLERRDFPTDIIAFLQSEEHLLKVCGSAVNWVQGSSYDVGSTPFLHALSGVKVNPPIPNPGKIVCVGLNYADHCQEHNWEIPTSPVLFAKFPTTIIGCDDPIRWPPDSSQQVDYEAELAVVLSRVARHVPAEQAYDYVGGYMIANDVSARDVQFADKQWVRGKSFDTFCPSGPYLVTHDEIGDPHQLSIKCWVNGELRQESNTDQLVFRIPELIAFISKTCTLLPGDILCTGTPGGVGVFRDPPVFLEAGDVVEIEIDMLGHLRNPVK